MTETTSNSTNALSAPLPWQGAQWAQLCRAFAASQLAHAYLLSGSEGLGKSLFADSFARYVLCLNPIAQSTVGGLAESVVACGTCTNCLKGGTGNHPDILTIEPEEGSKNIKIDQIRWLSEFVIRSSHSGGAKVAIIQGAHLLNANAANALLKTLEEPNDKTHVILVSDHPGRLVATIRSRCQKLAFQVPRADIAAAWLQAIIGVGNVDSILEASDMRPLIALQLAGGDSLQARAQFLQGICDVKTGKKSIQQVLALIAKNGESEVLQHFSAFLSKLTKYSLTGIQENEDDPALQSMYTLLVPSKEKSLAQTVASSLAHFYTEVETARRQLTSSTNPNPQLIMESILWQWSKLNLH
ncbi:MAG: DNA polymerase III subunit delta' [SAR86 cluster bacterium]|uniref:DNA polymerase III subunit delta' n=1 Tax=SAR86 cluster bacterium TaxID=2030880 RepID=A0A2A4X329_9GAMM|nr:MAG: DNA polymerase III subunit delta' [SAR86 cluster bacterium]